MSTVPLDAHPTLGSPTRIGWLDPRPAVARAWATDRLLTLAGLVMVVTFVGTLGGLIVDPRVIGGAPAWLKPAKFAVSISIYAFTFAWLLSYVQGHPRLVRCAAVVTAVAGLAEMLIIGGQVVRGTTSHFNVAAPLDAFLFARMRDFIIAIFLMNLLVGLLLLRQRLPDPVFAWGLRLGLLISLIGTGVGALMTVPIPAMRAAFDAGFGGAHSVGVADGGAGLPIVGWSTEGGDLRVGHFVGLHALQVLPLAAWLLTRRRFDRLGTKRQLILIWTVGLTYLGLVLLLTWQALRGQSVAAPDATTLVACGVLAGAAVAVIVGMVLSVRRQPGASSLPPSLPPQGPSTA